MFKVYTVDVVYYIIPGVGCEYCTYSLLKIEQKVSTLHPSKEKGICNLLYFFKVIII